jgi:hypothetical protein
MDYGYGYSLQEYRRLRCTLCDSTRLSEYIIVLVPYQDPALGFIVHASSSVKVVEIHKQIEQYPQFFFSLAVSFFLVFFEFIIILFFGADKIRCTFV